MGVCKKLLCGDPEVLWSFPNRCPLIWAIVNSHSLNAHAVSGDSYIHPTSKTNYQTWQFGSVFSVKFTWLSTEQLDNTRTIVTSDGLMKLCLLWTCSWIFSLHSAVVSRKTLMIVFRIYNTESPCFMCFSLNTMITWHRVQTVGQWTHENMDSCQWQMIVLCT